jgi:23S rRNA (pseudouridine1915-N3)-methyltransferase
LKPGPEAALFAQHNARLRPPLVVKEIPEARGSAAEIRRREGAALLAALPDGALAVALDLGGLSPDSEELAALTTKWEESGKILAFVIGGAEGLDPAVQARADHRISLGRMTWPTSWCAACWRSSSTAPRPSAPGTPTIDPGGLKTGIKGRGKNSPDPSFISVSFLGVAVGRTALLSPGRGRAAGPRPAATEGSARGAI